VYEADGTDPMGTEQLELRSRGGLRDALDLRPVAAADLPFLIEMTVLAAFAPEAAPDRAEEMPYVVRWVEDWGRDGDVGVVAWWHGERIGAAWCRILDEVLVRDEAGSPLPEIAIAVRAEHRSRGIGTALLAALADRAGAAGRPTLSLAVHTLNPARHLYERAGFVTVRTEGDGVTMTRR